MFEKAETFYVEGIRVQVSRRTVGVVDIEFVDDPPGFPGGYSIARTPSTRELTHDELLEDIRGTVLSLINDSSTDPS